MYVAVDAFINMGMVDNYLRLMASTKVDNGVMESVIIKAEAIMRDETNINIIEGEITLADPENRENYI